MLRLFAGRENIDKERFIYENITGETLVIVPNQYTLVAEEQALKYLGTDCLFDVEILSMNRLGLRVLTERGTESVNMLDKYGRFMLLSRLIKEHAGDFDIFRRSAGKISFTTMLNDFISEFKQQECSLDDVEAMLDAGETDELLRAKLSELRGVIEAYEEAIAGKYTDSEDYISMYIDAIGDSSFVRGKSVWIYGYDSITPKFTDAMLRLAETADSVSFIVNRNDFGLDSRLISMLRSGCGQRGIEFSCEEIGPEYEADKSETIRRIERGLWNFSQDSAERESNAEYVPEGLTLVSAANPWYEAESAAAYIWHLVRDLGYKMRDIQVIANDEASLQPVIRRVFAECGLPLFTDSSRDITDTAAAAFIVDMLWFVEYSGLSQYLFAMLKTGLAGSDIDPGLVEELENYAKAYHIRGSMWDRDFRYGEEALGAEKFAALNDLRGKISSKLSALRKLAEAETVAEFVPQFRAYLTDVWELDISVEEAAESAERRGLHDEAQRIIQSYRKSVELLDQIVEIMGDAEFDFAEFTDIYVAGLTDIEVGVIPPSADGLSMGTMIRTRPRPIRAAVIIGANEGVLPLSPSQEGLFSVDEKAYFRSKGFALGILDDIKVGEENAAMYRMMSRPSDKLYISWSMSDTEGGELSPSPVIDSLKAMFPRITADGMIKKDVISSCEDPLSSFNTPEESMGHLIERIKDKNAPERPDPLTQALLKWFSDNRGDELDTMLDAALDDNIQQPLGRDTARKLFGRSDGKLVLSASSIGSYFDCPFKYFIDRGLRPEEEREFSGDPRSVGDVYHECLMSVAEKLIADRGLIADVLDDDEALEELVSRELERIASQYRGGLFVSTGNEEFRMSRIREICAGAVRAMAVQLSSGSVIDAVFEEGFSRTGRFDPIRFNINGDEVLVEGKIDRSDVLDVNGSKRVRIIDYKTGKDSLDLWKMRNGFRMQLMIYMISAASGDLEPAGMFYFNIKDPIEGINDKSEGQIRTVMERAPEDVYKLKGKYIDEPGVIEAMPAEVLTGGRGTADRKITREEYEAVRKDVLDRIEETASGILRGKIDISPFKESKTLVCSRCNYKAICRRDREYAGNRAREIPPKPKESKEEST